jgi:hypothetical protein
VDQSLADQTVDDGSGFAEGLLRGGFVLGGDGGADLLDLGAQLGALTGVAGAMRLGLTRAFLCLCGVGQNNSPGKASKGRQLC